MALTSKPDSLSQWRAYCPRNGGYALGLPSKQLRYVGEEQGFYLAPCIYENSDQYNLVNGIIDSHLQTFEEMVSKGTDVETARDAEVKGFAKDIAEYGPILKHRSFIEESEWRLVSKPKQIDDPNIGFHPGPHSVVAHYEFKLATSTHPHLCVVGEQDKSIVVRIGPTSDFTAASFAVQALLLRYIGPGCWHGQTDSTYRGY